MKKTDSLVLARGVVVSILLSGCHRHPPEVSQAPLVGMANPASVYCQSLKGKSVLVIDSQGNYRNCLLPDGERIEEWALYRRDHVTK